MSNPLLSEAHLPAFQSITAEHVVPAVKARITENLEVVEQITQADSPKTWEDFVLPLEAMGERLSGSWSAVSHLNSVKSEDALRKAYEESLPLLSEYDTQLGQNQALYAGFQAIEASPEYANYSVSQKKLIKDSLRDFRLSGVGLKGEDKKRYAQLVTELSTLANTFSNHVMDATDNWHHVVAEEACLAGVPAATLEAAKHSAKEEKTAGWRFGLDFPTYHAIVTYADNRALREIFHEAFVTRASDQGPHDKALDNSDLMKQIVDKRHALAKLLGFSDYVEYSLETKMAGSRKEVMDFFDDFIAKAKPAAEKEYKALEAFAQKQGAALPLQPWDMAYYGEKMQQSLFEISQEDLRPYFPADRVISGLFETVNRLFGITVEELSGIDVWHEDVRFFEIKDPAGEVRGQFYLDLYARQKKRGGAWMDECVTRFVHKNQCATPVAFLTTNFRAPSPGQPSLWTHDEVITLFHEFGHGLHHMLTKIDFPSVAGINGVPWDAVELPSQFLENWCWEKEALNSISGHFETGEPLPDKMFQQLKAAKTFQAGMGIMRQMEFGLFDFRVHGEYSPEKGARVQEILDSVRQRVSVSPRASYNRFQHGFSHIFAGGYAAGYYSYLWAEVLSADAFSAFQEAGIFDKATGKRFLENILEQGGSREPAELFESFRGRPPEVEPLLLQAGLL